ncbi:MAG: hypothetical protein ACOVS5_04375, partial [Oligoflexus sp.]
MRGSPPSLSDSARWGGIGRMDKKLSVFGSAFRQTLTRKKLSYLPKLGAFPATIKENPECHDYHYQTWKLTREL